MTRSKCLRICALAIVTSAMAMSAFGQSRGRIDLEKLERQTARQMAYAQEKEAEYKWLKSYGMQWWVFAVIAAGYAMYERGVKNLKAPLQAFMQCCGVFGAVWLTTFPMGWLDGYSPTAAAIRNVSGWAFLVCGAFAFRTHLAMNGNPT